MKKGLILSIILAAAFITAVVGADSKQILRRTDKMNDRTMAKTARALPAASSVKPQTYRSPGRLRKVVINTADTDAMATAQASGAIELADYGSFKLMALDDATMTGDRGQETGDRQASANVNSLLAANDSRFAYDVRDDFNVLLLRSGAIDTSASDAPGNFIGFGRVERDESVTAASALKVDKHSSASLRLIQFIGPIKREWLEALRASGVEPIAYVPNNGYLVRASGTTTASLLKSASTGARFIQWEGAFADDYKIHPQLAEAMRAQPGADVTVAVQIASTPQELSLRASNDIKAAKQLATSLIGDGYPLLNFTNLRMRIRADRIADLAALPNVINVEPWNPPQLFDERADQISAGATTTDGKGASGPGYMSWLQAHGFTSQFDFAIDITDGGIDRGSIAADKLHPDFLNANRQSRVLYARDFTSEDDPGDTAGHGTINVSIAGGGSVSADKDSRDTTGYNYGLGIAPFALLGSSKIFQSSGRFDLIEPFSNLISQAYHDGARISSNSWGASSNSYTIDSVEYDARVRDAVLLQPGNQEMLICFASGNSGDFSVGSPGTGKNVISVGASESSRKDGNDGCGVTNDDSDSVMDMAFFSSSGPLDDGRIKPDIIAPGTHIQGAASQHPDFDGSGVCGEKVGLPYFPAGQTLYTWSSGTSHSTPQVAGAAALARQYFINRGLVPSAALIKALLLNSPTYMTGEGAGGNLPQARQGWGLMNLNRAFDSEPRIYVDQTTTFNDSGQEFVITGEVKDSAAPFRVTLAWTDAPGFSAFAPWVNNLDLEVAINGQVYRGNHFTGQESQPGGETDIKNNVESVWLPAGTIGTFVVRVRAANIAGDGLPGNADATDQDFALVVYNGEQKDAPVASVAAVTLAGGSDEFADPGETVSMRVSLGDLSPVALVGGHGTLTAKTTGVNVTTNGADFPNVAPGQTAENQSPFAFTVDRSIACGSTIQFTLDVTSGGLTSRVPFSVAVGKSQPSESFSDDIETGEAKWTHASAVKKKKKKLEPIDTWAISGKRVHSGLKSWLSTDPGKQVDAHLDTIPVALPADGRNLQLVFYHTFEFERGEFDGGVLEISSGGDFEDLGPKILKGGYNGEIWGFASNARAGLASWVDGRLGVLQQVVVDLSSYAGKTVTIRFRITTDVDGKGIGWYIDDVSLRGIRVSCTPAPLAPED
jgi:hypothetical protein